MMMVHMKDKDIRINVCFNYRNEDGRYTISIPIQLVNIAECDAEKVCEEINQIDCLCAYITYDGVVSEHICDKCLDEI